MICLNVWLNMFNNWDKVCCQSEVGWDSVVSYMFHMSSITQHWLTPVTIGANPFNHSTLMGWQGAGLQRSFITCSCVRNRMVMGVTVTMTHTHTHRPTYASNTQVIFGCFWYPSVQSFCFHPFANARWRWHSAPTVPRSLANLLTLHPF